MPVIDGHKTSVVRNKELDRRHGIEKNGLSYEPVRTILMATIEFGRCIFPLLFPGKAESIS